MCPREDSNLYRKLRKLIFYPLNYGDMLFYFEAMIRPSVIFCWKFLRAWLSAVALPPLIDYNQASIVSSASSYSIHWTTGTCYFILNCFSFVSSLSLRSSKSEGGRKLIFYVIEPQGLICLSYQNWVNNQAKNVLPKWLDGV